MEMDFQTQFKSALKAYCALRNVGMDETFLTESTEPNPTPTIKELDTLWRKISHGSGDALFGLHFGESMQLTALGIVGQIITTSKTVGEALAKGASMVPLIVEGFEINHEVIGDTVHIEIQGDEEISAQHPYYHNSMRDFLAALIIHELDGLIVDTIEPIQIRGPFTKDRSKEYFRVLRCREYSHSETMGILIDIKFLGTPIITANYRMQQFLQSLLKEKTSIDLSITESLKSRVGTYIMGNSYLRILSIDDVAANFNLSARSLQRKLREEGS